MARSVTITFAADRAKGAPELNGRTFTFAVEDKAIDKLLGKQLSNLLNGLVKGSAARPAMDVAEAVAAVERIAAGASLGKNTKKAAAVGGMLALPSDTLRLMFNAVARDVKEAIVAELTRRGESAPELPPVRTRKAK